MARNTSRRMLSEMSRSTEFQRFGGAISWETHLCAQFLFVFAWQTFFMYLKGSSALRHQPYSVLFSFGVLCASPAFRASHSTASVVRAGGPLASHQRDGEVIIQICFCIFVAFLVSAFVLYGLRFSIFARSFAQLSTRLVAGTLLIPSESE